jgi:hypothetical protein
MRAVAVVSVLALVITTAASAATITRHARTKSYSLTLVVGPSESMYTQAQVKKLHPKSGEVMLAGAMSGGSMSMHANRHLELSVKSRATGRVVTNVSPQISLYDAAGKGTTFTVDAVAMQGIGMAMSDVHYGDNVALVAGHVYRVHIVVGGEPVTLSFTAV